MGEIKINIDRIGSDPEVFLKKGNLLISAIDLLPGSKDRPFRISEDEFVHVDNVLAEFNVKPSKTADEMWQSIVFCIHSIEQLTGASALISSSEEMPEKELSSPEAWQFGCSADYSAYGKSYSKNMRTRLRTAGGHIAVSFANHEQVSRVVDYDRLVRCFDEKVTKPFIQMGVENDERRRSMYGQPGMYRIKDFGFEYRTLSNQWIKDYSTVEKMFELVKDAVEYYNNGGDVKEGTYNLIAGNLVEKQLEYEEI
jgi:hypothetical protein